VIKKPIKFAKPFPKKARAPTQLELDIQTELNHLESIRAQKEKLYEDNVEIFEAMSQLEAEEETALNTIRRLAHTYSEPPEGLNMMTSKTARMAEGRKLVVEVQYKKASDYVDLRELKGSKINVCFIKSINMEAFKRAAKNSPKYARAIKPGKWQTPSVSVKPLAEATPPGGDPKYVNV
jgi:hypothetical protein